MILFRSLISISAALVLLASCTTNETGIASQLDEYNVIWYSQSKNSKESMPCGGGDIGLNVWVENGDLLFYVDRSGNIDEKDQLLKNGRIRINMNPSPFSKDGNDVFFKQELDLKTGSVLIEGETPDNNAAIRVWVEVRRPVIHVEMVSEEESTITASFESWRNEKQLIPASDTGSGGGRDYNRWACYGYVSYKGDVYSYPDEISFENNNRVLFYHRNGEDRIFDKELAIMRMDGVMDQIRHTTLNRIFGGMMLGENLTSGNITEGEYTFTPFKAWNLKSLEPAKKHHVQLMLHTEQNESLEEWKANLDKRLSQNNSSSEAWLKNLEWWEKFWNRSHIFINQGMGPKNIGWQVGRNYQLMRYMLACNYYGEFPTHFNGGLFIYDHYYVDWKEGMDPSFYNADYRKWGAWTGMNQRLVHWPMLKSGDFDMMRPQFDYFKKNLINAQLRNEVSWGIKGASFAEQIGSGGLPNGYHYGWEIPYGTRKPDHEVGMQHHHTHYFHTQIEFAFMMHQWYRFTGADISEYIPFMKDAVIHHFEYHKMLQRRRNGKDWDQNGKLVLKNMQSSESYKPGDNPVLELASLKKNLEALIELPDKWVSEEEKKQFRDWKERVPDLEYRMRNGFKTIAPLAEGNYRYGNREIPQLYPVFPYGMYAVGLPDLEVGINTWKYGLDSAKGNWLEQIYGPGGYPQRIEWWGWGQQAIFLARLGLTEEAQDYVSKKMSDSRGDPMKEPDPLRFPAFWGPGYGCMPSMEWGAVGMIALQEMLIQTIARDGKEIRILPAWPEDWDVDFKLFAPGNTTVECDYEHGKIMRKTIIPEKRKDDVVTGKN